MQNRNIKYSRYSTKESFIHFFHLFPLLTKSLHALPGLLAPNRPAVWSSLSGVEAPREALRLFLLLLSESPSLSVRLLAPLPAYHPATADRGPLFFVFSLWQTQQLVALVTETLRAQGASAGGFDFNRGPLRYPGSLTKPEGGAPCRRIPPTQRPPLCLSLSPFATVSFSLAHHFPSGVCLFLLTSGCTA